MPGKNWELGGGSGVGIREDGERREKGRWGERREKGRIGLSLGEWDD